MKCTLVRFLTYVTGSNLAEIVKIENTRISNSNDVKRRSDCEIRLGPVKLNIEFKSDLLLICFTFVTKSPGKDTACVEDLL